ncbi:general stress protein [Sabulicella rubraurantiaca]|uniref:general stress protein n=1 Tax=Sabulicella rubraurantiaca TaxID=2811429 RepID=UPI001A96077E|nr:general stress protein [Sabulicella rubraurantiaca]
MQTIVKLFDDYSQAEAAVRDLEAAGFAAGDISILHRRADGEISNASSATDTNEASGAGVGATIGTVVGGGAGLLAGLGLLAIPGLGPVVAAGWLIAAATTAGVGAAAGGLLGALTSAGVEESDAHVYAEGVKRGGTLVTVRAADATQAANAETIMARHQPVSLRERGETYRSAGWTQYELENEASDLPRGGGYMDDNMRTGITRPHGETRADETAATRPTLDGRV